MSKALYMVTISSGSLPVDTMVFDNKAQAEAAAEYFKLYYDEECYIIDIEINEIIIDTDDYISKLNEYQKQLIEEERDEEEGYIKAEIEHIQELISSYESKYGVEFNLQQLGAISWGSAFFQQKKGVI